MNSHVRKHPAKSQRFPVGAYATFDPGVQSPSFRSVLFPNAFVSFPFVSIPFRENRLFSVRAGGTCQWAILVREVFDRLSVRCLGCAFGPKNVNYAFLT